MRNGKVGVVLAAALVLAGLTGADARGVAAQQLDPDEIHDAVEARATAAFDLYRELLSLPNDSQYPEDILDLLAWLEGAFGRRGFNTDRIPTAGSPVLLAERRSPGADRTVLVYLQADGQPVDPSAWSQDDPYQAVLKAPGGDGGWEPIPWSRLQGERDPDWRIFARSASDSKGPIAQFLSALDILEEKGVTPDFHMKVIVDTEEERGSPNLPPMVEEHRDRLAADMLVIFDGPPHASGRPSLKFGARGIALATLVVYGPRAPQHSGHYGNYAPNPAIRLAEIIATFKDDAGRVVIPGWYDGIELDAEDRRVLARVPDDPAEIRRDLGIAAPDSVAGSLQEAVQYPSLNVRGMRAGWVGSEARTIIPDTAVAEIDIRLVQESDGERLLELLRSHVRGLGYHLVDGAPSESERLTHARLASLQGRVAYAAFRTDFQSLPGRWLTEAYRHLFGETPIRIRTSGGSIPISPFVETLGVPAVSVPTVNPDNNQHSPDENLRVGSFLQGIRILTAVLSQPLPDSG